MKKVKFTIVLLFAFLPACSSLENSSSKVTNTSADTASIVPNEQPRDIIKNSSANTAQPQKISLEETDKSQTAPTVIERKIIRNAELNLEANSPEETQQKISAIAAQQGGFVIESTQSSSDVKTTTRNVVTMTVRVPSAKFNETLDEIRKTASRVRCSSARLRA